MSSKTTRCPTLVLIGVVAITLTVQPRALEANCEAGAYLIHTTAQYAELDGAEWWLFRVESLDDGRVLLEPTPAETEQVVWRLHGLLAGADGSDFQMAVGSRTCKPDLATVGLARPERLMDRLVLLLEPCLPLPLASVYAHYDRTTRTLRFPESLPVLTGVTPAASASLEARLRERVFDLRLVAAEGSERRIESADVEQIRYAHHAVGHSAPTGGEAPLLMSIAVLRLRNLEELLGSAGGYLEADLLQGRLADFPVVFLQRPGREPTYIADGSWCGGYRLGMEANSTREASSDEDRLLGALERFRISGAWDVAGDGLPDLLQVNESFLYWLEPDGRLLVVDYQQGC